MHLKLALFVYLHINYTFYHSFLSFTIVLSTGRLLGVGCTDWSELVWRKLEVVFVMRRKVWKLSPKGLIKRYLQEQKHRHLSSQQGATGQPTRWSSVSTQLDPARQALGICG